MKEEEGVLLNCAIDTQESDTQLRHYPKTILSHMFNLIFTKGPEISQKFQSLV